jgi:tRNA G18 (ribose-2'-O)-methylase SpoU
VVNLPKTPPKGGKAAEWLRLSDQGLRDVRLQNNPMVSTQTSQYHWCTQQFWNLFLITLRMVDSLNDGGLMPYRTLRHTADHEKQRIFVAEGEKVVDRLIQSGHRIVSVLTTHELLQTYEKSLENLEYEVFVFVASKNVLSTIVGFHLHQGIMAVAQIPPARSLDVLLNQSARPRLLVALDGLTNSENLGVLVRNCVAFGVQGLLVGETSSNPYLRRSVRNSMGTIFKLPVVLLSDLAQTLRDLNSVHHIHVIAAHPHNAQTPVEKAPYLSDCCLVFGSEGEGISKDVLDACSETVAIRMASGVDSLNVASASAVFLYEVMKQRQTG